jgi:hypothetical protein
MRRLLLLPLFAAVLLAAPKPVGIPAHATQIGPGTYRFKDKQGQTWIYRQTPFGVTHFVDCGERYLAVAAQNRCPATLTEPRPLGSGLSWTETTRATAQGGTIQFERPGPFGVYRWQKKESDLNEQEQAVWRATRRQD